MCLDTEAGNTLSFAWFCFQRTVTNFNIHLWFLVQLLCKPEGLQAYFPSPVKLHWSDSIPPFLHLWAGHLRNKKGKCTKSKGSCNTNGRTTKLYLATVFPAWLRVTLFWCVFFLIYTIILHCHLLTSKFQLSTARKEKQYSFCTVWLIMPLLKIRHFELKQYHKVMLLENRIMHQSFSKNIPLFHELHSLITKNCSLFLQLGDKIRPFSGWSSGVLCHFRLSYRLP